MKFRVGALLTLSVHVSASGSALALQGGDPGDLDSCYAKCGDASGTGGLRCGCDAACEAFGDCCEDRSEWCASTAVSPVCGLVNDSKQYSRVCGTDLGFAFVHEGRVELLFGDTWHYPPQGGTVCSDPGLLGEHGSYNDDSQARFLGGTSAPSWLPQTASAARPDGANCPVALEFDRTAATEPYTFAPMSLRGLDGKELSLGLSNTPLTGFSDGKTAFAFFGRGGIDDRRAFVARRDARERTVYHVIADLGHESKFHNPTAARVTSESNYDTPEGAEPSLVYVWGRPRFSSSSSESPASNAVILSRARLPFYDPETGRGSWAPEYFGGFESNTHAPRWVRNEAEAKPVIVDDFKRVNQLDIKWIAALGKWVMLYGGDVGDGLAPLLVNDQPRHGAIHMRMADHPWGPWTRPTPLLWREHVPWWYQCDAYDDTKPQGCDRKNLRPPFYSPGDWKPRNNEFIGAQCRTSHPKPAQMPNTAFPFPLCMSMSQRGNLYAPNLLPTWTRRGPIDPATRMATTTIYFVVSTWYPYDVVLAAADIQLPERGYGQLRLQLRGQRGLMLGVDAQGTLTASAEAGGRDGGPTAFWIERADRGGGAPKIGDEVRLRSARTGRYLSRRGSDLTMVDTATVAASWKLESASASAPVGTAVVPGGTPFRLAAAGEGEASAGFIALEPSGPVLRSGATESSVFRFTDGCLKGDKCAPRAK